MELAKKLAIVILLPAVVIYFVWMILSALATGHSYFPRVGYYARGSRPGAYWAMIGLNAVFAVAFAAGWLFLLKELIDNWQ
jgi:hypothetical protein